MSDEYPERLLRQAATEPITFIEDALNAFIDALRDTIDPLRREMHELLRLERRYQEDGPVEVVLRGSPAIGGTGANVSVDLGGPAVGRKWELRHLSVGGANWSSVVAGTAELYIAASDPLAGRNLADLVDQAVTLPDLAFYQADQVMVRNPDHLYVVIVSPTSSAQYAVGGGAIDRPDKGEPR